MRAQLSNAAYGVLDYAAYPVGMLLVAPVVLHRLGAAEYGIWAVATAAVSTGGIIASGFGDANILYVAKLRAARACEALGDAVRCMVGINLVLGTILALIGWALSPYAARHIASSNPGLQYACLVSLRIASVLMLVRALESVSISTIRAFERYGAAVRISIGIRLLTLGVAAVLATRGKGIATIMQATAVLFVFGTAAQLFRLRHLLGGESLWPAFAPQAMRSLFGFGIFSWLQAIAGVVFSQVDRLLLGVSLGAVTVASYALCIQLAQPVFGLTASCFHFLFPYLSGRVGTMPAAKLNRQVLQAFACNLCFVAIGTVLLLLFGVRVLHLWAGEAIALAAAPIFPMILIGSALLGLSVTATYALLALGRMRMVAWFNIGGGLLMLLLMWWLLPRNGVYGLATARLFYGSFLLLLYLPLVRQLLSGRHAADAVTTAASLNELEEVVSR